LCWERTHPFPCGFVMFLQFAVPASLQRADSLPWICTASAAFRSSTCTTAAPSAIIRAALDCLLCYAASHTSCVCSALPSPPDVADCRSSLHTADVAVYTSSWLWLQRTPSPTGQRGLHLFSSSNMDLQGRNLFPAVPIPRQRASGLAYIRGYLVRPAGAAPAWRRDA
jgi:hypothetical protein